MKVVYSAEEHGQRAWSIGLAWFGAALALYGLVLFGSQAVSWLQAGAWSPVPISAPFWIRGDLPFPYTLVPKWPSQRVFDYMVSPEPGTWVGLRSIVLWLFDLPLALVSFIVGATLGSFQVSALGSIERIARQRQMRQQQVT